MVVFAGAGIDVTLKQLVKDALPLLLARNESAQEELRKFAARRLGNGSDQQRISLLAAWLTSLDPRISIISEYKY